MQKSVIVVAGGKGLRMGHALPKQFLPLGGKPVLMHTIDAFAKFDSSILIVLVLPIEQQDYWKTLCMDYHFNVPHTLADGGETRFHSVLNGLKAAPDSGLIAVHDGVRPFVSRDTIVRSFLAAARFGAAIPVTIPVESVREVVGNDSYARNRDEFRMVQTPQTFKAEVLKESYLQMFSPNFTDDASVVEASGFNIQLVDGNVENIKITTPFDLMVAEAIVARSAAKV